MTNKSDFHLSMGQILVRLAPLLLLGIVAFVEAASGARGDWPYEVGSEAIRYDDRADKIVVEHERPRVAASLENGRGVVAINCRNGDADSLNCLPVEHFVSTGSSGSQIKLADIQCDTQVMVADAWEGVSAFCFERVNEPARKGFIALSLGELSDLITERPNEVGRLRATSVTGLLPSTRRMCPASECLDVEHGGIAIDDAGDLTVAEPHNDRVTTFRLGLRPPARLPNAEVIGKVQYSGRAGTQLHDVTSVPGAGIVVAESSPLDTKLSSVRLFTNSEAPPLELVSGVQAPYPVGVWFSRDTNRVYVTDVSNGVQRWLSVERVDGKWRTPRTFWSARDDSSKPPLLRHMITGWSEDGREVLFASGPDGLYVIDPAGLLLAKYSLQRPLRGLDWGRSDELFFSSGRLLSVLRVNETMRPRNPNPPPVSTPAPPAAQPAAQALPVKPALNTPPVRRPPVRKRPLKAGCPCR
jgi:hypothetical protein